MFETIFALLKKLIDFDYCLLQGFREKMSANYLVTIITIIK